jgi:hypothetical protein
MANSIDAFIPEIWAAESLRILEENMVVMQLVNRDFNPAVANFGDTVHTRKPAEFTAQRKGVDDDVTDQSVAATDIEVKLNQHIHVSFVIKDGEETKSFKSLVDFYLSPAMLAQARFADQVVLGQWPQFMKAGSVRGYTAGKLGALTKTTAVDEILNLRNVMNVNKADPTGRHVIWTPYSETAVLATEAFLHADKRGDGGAALREASMGRTLGFDHFMCQNMSYVPSGNTTVTGAVNNASGYEVGDTAITVDGLSAAITNGTWVTIGGDMTPQRVTSTTGGATPTELVISPGLRHAVVDDAAVTVYTPGAVNLAAGYAAGWYKAITVDGFTVAPQVGQMVAFGTATDLYTVIGAPTTTSIVLDRPLDAAIADDAKVNIGPAGNYNLAFHRNAITVVNRPLIMPRAGAGAIAGAATRNGLAMRVVIQYDSKSQGHRVVFDMLFGVKVVEPLQGAVLFG